MKTAADALAVCLLPFTAQRPLQPTQSLSQHNMDDAVSVAAAEAAAAGLRTMELYTSMATRVAGRSPRSPGVE